MQKKQAVKMTLYKTSNYDMFKYIASNRPIEEHHVKEVMAEIFSLRERNQKQ